MTQHSDRDTQAPQKIVGIDRSATTRQLPPVSRTAAISAANAAVRTIAPLWPLESFVAVNPFLGISSLPFADADNTPVAATAPVAA